MKVRIVFSILLLLLAGVLSLIIDAPATLALGQVAGRQFDASDASYLAIQGIFSGYRLIRTIIAVLLLAALISIWYRPLRDLFERGLNILLVVGLSASLIATAWPQPALAYYADTDYTENYFILPNESAFFIPDVGDNKSNQASFGSEAYLSEKKIAAKRFEIPHTKLANSGFWNNKYVPAGRLIVVDRTPVSREWVKQPHRGTDKSDQSFPCQSSEGLDITVGVAIGASVYEESAAKFLFRFGVNPPTGDRNDPNVVFTSVYRGKSLAEVMDGPVRSRVQSLVCDEMTARSLDDNNRQAAKIMESIQKKVGDYMTSVGITLDFIGWADTFNFDKEVQDAMNRRYVASQDILIAQTMAPHVSTLQGLAQAEGTRRVAEKWNGALPTSVSLWWLPSSISDMIGKFGAPGGDKK